MLKWFQYHGGGAHWRLITHTFSLTNVQLDGLDKYQERVIFAQKRLISSIFSTEN